MAENYDPVIFTPEALEPNNIYSNKIDINGKFWSISIFTLDNDYFLHGQIFTPNLPLKKDKTSPTYKRLPPGHLNHAF